MAADRPTHPSPYSRTNRGLQLARNPAARVSLKGLRGKGLLEKSLSGVR